MIAPYIFLVNHKQLQNPTAPVTKEKENDIIPMYEKYNTVGTKPLMCNLAMKYQMEYQNKYIPEDAADKNDLHHHR